MAQEKELQASVETTGEAAAEDKDVLTEAAPDAVISENVFDCYEEDAPSSQEDIKGWVEELGLGQSAESSSPALAESLEEGAPETAQETDENGARQISVQFGENTVIYELNDSAAATSLYEQLPLSLEEIFIYELGGADYAVKSIVL